MTFIKLPKAITAEELLSTPLPPVKWIVPGLLPAGSCFICWSQQGGQKLADIVAVPAGRTG